jgi:hypothetical protein
MYRHACAASRQFLKASSIGHGMTDAAPETYANTINQRNAHGKGEIIQQLK